MHKKLPYNLKPNKDMIKNQEEIKSKACNVLKQQKKI